MRVTDLLDRLEHVKKAGDGWTSRCPSHTDKVSSLSIGEGDNGRTVLHCHAGCETADIVRSVGLDLKDLFPEEDKPVQRTIEATYDYTDEDGNLLYQAVRYRPKDFMQRQPDGDGGWTYKTSDVRRVLYRLPDIIDAIREGQRIWITEGEKDVESLRAIGEVATTNVGGAGKWRPEYTEMLKGAKTVIVVADRDGPGLKHAEALIAELREAGFPSVVGGQAKVGKDITDHLEAGHGLDELERIDPEKKANGIILEKFSVIKAEQPEWVSDLEGFVPFRAITLLAGEQGTNKSTFACYLAWKITSQYDGDVMYVTTEGDPGVEIKPRLLAAGADVDRCHMVRRVTEGFDSIVAFPVDVREIEAEDKKTGTRLLVIDPVLAHVDVEDSNNDNSIRTALAPLAQMAQRQNMIVLLIAHINKDRSMDPFKRVGGSKGLTGIARSNLLMGKLFEGRPARAIASFKSSWADPTHALQYRIEEKYVPEIDGNSIWCKPMGTVNVTAHALLSERRGEEL